MSTTDETSSATLKLSFIILLSPLLGAGFCTSDGPFEPLPPTELYCLQGFSSTVAGVRLGRYNQQEQRFVDTSSNSYVYIGSASDGLGQGASTIHLEYDFAVRSSTDTRVELVVTTSTAPDPYVEGPGQARINETIHISAASPDCPWTQVTNFYIRYDGYDAQIFEEKRRVKTLLIARDSHERELFRQVTPQIYDSTASF